jgi:hypothetical protein
VRARTRDANRAYGIGTAIVLAAVLTLSVGTWSLRPAELDPTTLCPTSRPIAGHTVVIVDRTDRWNPAIAPTLTDLIEKAQRDTPQYGKFSIVSLDADNSAHPLFSVCNPGAPTVWSDIYRGRRYTQRDFDEKFVGAADHVLAQIETPSEASASPIVEYVHRWLGGDDFNASTPTRRLILISDMRQNSPLYSIYANPQGDGLTPVVQSQFGESAKGVTFDVYFVAHQHGGNVSEAQVQSAWDRAFAQLGAQHTWRQIT